MMKEYGKSDIHIVSEKQPKKARERLAKVIEVREPATQA